MHWLERTELLLGDNKIEQLKKSNVLVFGLGGVGAIAAEMVCRAGIGNMTIIDGDKFEITNLNRQIHAVNSTIGKSKAEVVGSKLKDINPELNLIVLDKYFDEDTMKQFNIEEFDYVIDAIDTLSPKVELLALAYNKDIPIISSFGSGGKFDPTKIKITDIKKSQNCKFGRFVRKRLHQKGIYKGIKVVWSPEDVDKSAVREEYGRNKRSTVGTISFMPSIFGCYCASVVINDLLNEQSEEQAYI